MTDIERVDLDLYLIDLKRRQAVETAILREENARLRTQVRRCA